jgi:adenosylcobinamide-GDP ribazoletransferase
MTNDAPAASWPTEVKLCIAFSTRLPLAPAGLPSPCLARALRFNALAGLLVGGFAVAIYVLAQALGLPPFLDALLALAAALWFTGALHEDGLADFVDALGGSRSRLPALEIMRDSRIGSFGAAAIFFSLAIRASALAALEVPALALAGLVASHAFARGIFPAAIYIFPPARQDGLGAGAGQARGGDAAFGLLLGALLAWAALGFGPALLAAFLALLSAGVVLCIAQRRLGGYTGDVLGAAEQVAEMTVILTWVAIQ